MSVHTHLYRCYKIFGNATVVDHDPHFSVYRDLYYFPDSWGLYDHGQKLVPATAYFRGGAESSLLNATHIRDFRPAEIKATAPDCSYYFLGHISAHFGHFLLATLSRLWAYPAEAPRDIKLVTYGAVDAAAYSGHPFIFDILGTLGIGHDRLVSFDTPTRLPHVMVASPSFEETNFIHRNYVRLCRQIAARLIAPLARTPSATPIYFAKYKLPSGVSKLTNEPEIVEILARHGIDIVFPEQLSIAAQLRLYHDRGRITGLVGSAFHAAAFAPPRKLMILNYNTTMMSNQVLIDRACGHDPLYLFPSSGVDEIYDRDNFMALRTMRDPRGVAEQMLRILDPFMDIRPTNFRALANPFDRREDAANPPNLALRRPARQSSVSVHSLHPTTAADAAGAVSGFLTGRYQFHTEHEDEPWWDVDLGGATWIGEIHLFNRADQASYRSSRFLLSVSLDDLIWTPIHHRGHWPPFGGMDGTPFVWRATTPLLARFVRFTQFGHDYLHLDQVAIYGPTSDGPRRHAMPPRRRRLYLMTQSRRLICFDGDGGLVARDPADIDDPGALVAVDVDPADLGGIYHQSLHGKYVIRAHPVASDRVEGLVVHLLADPFTAALSRHARYYTVDPRDNVLTASHPTLGAAATFARVNEDAIGALLAMVARETRGALAKAP